MNTLKISHSIGQSLILLALLCTAGGTLSGCIQSKSFAATFFKNNATPQITDTTLKSVNAVFNNAFRGGDWYYQGAEAVNGTINAYIQVSQKLDMGLSAQQNYLKKAICPSQSASTMWQELKDVPLSVHIYTFSKKFTVYAECDNPLV